MSQHSLHSDRQQNTHPVSERVLDAVAREEGTCPLEFDQRLNNVVDPDALNALFQGASSDGTLEFSFRGYQILVHADGRITLTP